MENIIKNIRQYYPVSDEALSKLINVLTPERIAAKTIILRPGRLNRKVYFIEKGITRSYTILDGKETTSWFSKEGEFTCSSLSMYRDQPGFEYVETLEETLAYTTSSLSLVKLFESDLELANWWRVYMQESFLYLQDIHLARLKLQAKDRYDMMLKRFPDICLRVNLGYVASFLGITLPSLSRIRAGKG